MATRIPKGLERSALVRVRLTAGERAGWEAGLEPRETLSELVRGAVDAGLGEWIETKGRRRADSWVGFHTFRHTRATRLIRGGRNALQVQRMLGHHKPSFTIDVYTHLLDDELAEPVPIRSSDAARQDVRDDVGQDLSAKPGEPIQSAL